ncbi:MAG: SOS response-associated peptidase [Haloarculaceae archaeon]
MCGRYSLATPPADLAERFDVRVPDDLSPRYNCAPGQELPVITSRSPDRVERLEWGLVPEWADDDSRASINARAETVTEKPSFADAFERRRCLVPADGFYEWADRGTGKRPYRVAFEDDRPFAMAGIWERWTPPTAQAGLGDFGGGGVEVSARETFAVLTTEPNDLVADLHHRMAVILSPEEERRWLEAGPGEALDLLDTHPDDELHAYPVSSAVGDVSNDSPDLIEPASD